MKSVLKSALILAALGVLSCRKEPEVTAPILEDTPEPRWLVTIHENTLFGEDTIEIIDVAYWEPGEDIVVLEQRETDWAFWFYYPWQGEDTIRYSVVYKYEDYGFGGKGLWVNGKLAGLFLGSLDRSGKYNIPHPEAILTVTATNASNFLDWVHDTNEKVEFPNLKVVMLDISSRAFQYYPKLVPALKTLSDQVKICLLINYRRFDEDSCKYDVTDCQLEELAELKNLRELKLWSSKITNAGVRHLSECSNLRVLNLSGDRFGNEGIKTLSSLVSLKELTIISSRITNRGLRYITSIKNLRSLILLCERVDGQGIKFLRNMQKLEELGLFNIRLLDADLENLIYLTNLRRLYLNAPITDEGLRYLEKLFNLRILYLEYSKVTPAGLAKLKEALPSCEIVVKDL